jgi:hypothetical protein
LQANGSYMILVKGREGIGAVGLKMRKLFAGKILKRL